MTILGIDPGTTESAVVIWDGSKIHLHAKLPNEDVMTSLHVWTVLAEVVACEHIQCFGMAVGKEVFETAYFIGRLEQASFSYGRPWRRVYRSEVKSHWCHSARATDANIRQAVIDRLGAPGTKKAPGPTYGIHGDEWSALAIAVYAHDTAAA